MMRATLLIAWVITGTILGHGFPAGTVTYKSPNSTCSVESLTHKDTVLGFDTTNRLYSPNTVEKTRRLLTCTTVVIQTPTSTLCTSPDQLILCIAPHNT